MKPGRSGPRRPMPASKSTAETTSSRESGSNENDAPHVPQLRSGFDARTGKPLQHVASNTLKDSGNVGPGAKSNARPRLAPSVASRSSANRFPSATEGTLKKAVRDQKIQNTSDAIGPADGRKRFTHSVEQRADTPLKPTLASALAEVKEGLAALPLEEQLRYSLLLLRLQSGKFGVEGVRHVKNKDVKKLLCDTEHEVHHLLILRGGGVEKFGRFLRILGKASDNPLGQLAQVDPSVLMTGKVLAQYENLRKQAALTADEQTRLWEFSQRLAIHVMRTLDGESDQDREKSAAAITFFINVLNHEQAHSALERSFLRLAEGIKQEIAAGDAIKGAVLEDVVRQAMLALLESRRQDI